MEQRASADFWQGYGTLPQQIRERADKQFLLLKDNSQNPSLQFKKIGERNGQEVWSARVTLNCRALAIKRTDGYLWFWIGDHKTYDALKGLRTVIPLDYVRIKTPGLLLLSRAVAMALSS